MPANQSDPPNISVITPTKNRLKLLGETIDSVQRQSFGAWEHIIVDDGSDDGTAQEVASRAAEDPRIRYIPRNGEKSGANVCRNIGLRKSRSNLIVLLDSDDQLRPGCLERRVEIMTRNAELDFSVFQGCVFVNSVGDLNRLYHPQTTGDDLLRFLSHECVWEITSPIWRRGFLEKLGGFDEALLSMQDMELHVRAICAAPKYIFIPEIDHDIRGQDDITRTSMRHFRQPSYIAAAEQVREKLCEAVLGAGLMTWSRQRALVGLCFGNAESWVRAKQLGTALRVWTSGCRQPHASAFLWIAGAAMLCIRRAGAIDNGFCARLVNKWKGWVRFRQEPSLLPANKRYQKSSVTTKHLTP